MANLLANFTIPVQYAETIYQASIEQNALIKSGIATLNPVIAQKLAGGGSVFHLPTVAALDEQLVGEANIPTDDISVQAALQTPVGRDQKILRLERNRTFGQSDLVPQLTGTDPLAALSMYLGSIQDKDRQKSLVSMLKGAVNASVTGADTARVVDISAETGSAAVVNASQVANLASVFGDSLLVPMEAAIFMHSKTYAALVKSDMTAFERASYQSYGLGGTGVVQTFLGMQVFVDDTLPVSGDAYTTYVVKRGAIHFGAGTAEVPFEVTRDALAGNGAGASKVALRDVFAYHVDGFSFTGSTAGVIATNAELATPGNWTQVKSTKHIKVAALVHKVA